MKLDKIEKIVIAAVIFLVVNAIGMNYYDHKKYNHNRALPIYINDTEENKLPENIRELSQKYQSYTEFYKSDKPVLVYSYTTFKKQDGRDKDFHKKLSEKLEQENIDIEKIIFENWEDDTTEIVLKNQQYLDETETCGPSGEEEEKLKDFIDTTHHCINNICIIDVKNHRYLLLSPDVDYIASEIKKYYQK